MGYQRGLAPTLCLAHVTCTIRDVMVSLGARRQFQYRNVYNTHYHNCITHLDGWVPGGYVVSAEAPPPPRSQQLPTNITPTYTAVID